MRYIGSISNTTENNAVFETKVGFKQGFVLKPILFPAVTDDVIKNEKLKTLWIGNCQMTTRAIKALMFADDITILAYTKENSQYNLEILKLNFKR